MFMHFLCKLGGSDNLDPTALRLLECSRVISRTGTLYVWPHTFVSPSADSRRAVVSYWRQYVHEVLVNHLGGLGLLTDHPDMTLDFSWT